MGIPVPHRLVERSVRLFEAEAARFKEHQPAVERPTARVITLSRQLGSGGRRIADGLSELLGWPVWDREILDVLASRSSRQMAARMFGALDELDKGHVDAVLQGWTTGVNSYQYDYLLPRAILTIAQHDAIIVGRGAHHFLPDALRVRVVAPVQVRAKNLVTFERLTEDEARAQIALSDAERQAFLAHLRRRLPQRNRHDPEAEYDLVINTGKVRIHDAATLIADIANAVLPTDVLRQRPVHDAPAPTF